MVHRCCVCGIYQEKADENRSYHLFPKSFIRRQQWLNQLCLTDVSTSSFVCSDHFSRNDFSDLQGSDVERRRLKSTAVPLKIKPIFHKKGLEPLRNINVNEQCIINNLPTCKKQNIFHANVSVACESVKYSNASNTLIDQIDKENVSDCESQQLSERNYPQMKNDETLKTTSEVKNMPLKRKGDEISELSKKRIRANVHKRTLINRNKMKKQTQCHLKLDTGYEKFSREHFSSNRKWEAFKNYVIRTRRINSNTKKQKKRLKQRVTTLKKLLKTLKNRNFLSSHAEDQVKASLSPGAQKLIEGVLKGKKYTQYPDELKAFALTLHFYAPNGYNFVRKSFMKMLPHPSTLRAWLQTINYNPGISSEALESVNKLVASAALENKELYFNLTVDEMSIRKHVQWNKCENKIEGTIDLGKSDESYDNSECATNAIVFMLVCINKHFKIPIAYYLINALSAEEKMNLLKPILYECHSNNIHIRHITFDGASSNIGMVEEIGAHIYNNMSTAYFLHPDSDKPQRVYTSLDACHMLKLARTAIASSDLTDGDNNTISWKFIQRLVELQEKEGLHLATKIRKRHTNFQNEKMKVSLAAQTLSTSVAIALDVCAIDLELPEFEGAESTAKYCRIIDESFDILNSKNQFCKNPRKQAISEKNLQDIKLKVKANVNYIQSLKIKGQPICESTKRTAFIGLIIALNNVVQLADDLFKEGQLHYLCTYKLSQDHLETFFSCIRRCGGFNNNPNVMQFKSAYRKLMSHVSITVSLSANCTPLDGTSLLKPPSSNNNKTTTMSGSEELLSDKIFDLHDLLKSLSEINLSEYASETIAYVSGAIVKMIEKRVKCGLCLKSLKTEAHEEAISVLQRRKAYGNLVSASEHVILINKVAEKVLRAQVSLTQKNIKEKLIIQTLRALPMNTLFSKYDHVLEEEPLGDHRNQLIKLVLDQYFQTRLHYEATCMLDIQIRIRKRNNNLTKFQGQ